MLGYDFNGASWYLFLRCPWGMTTIPLLSNVNLIYLFVCSFYYSTASGSTSRGTCSKFIFSLSMLNYFCLSTMTAFCLRWTSSLDFSFPLYTTVYLSNGASLFFFWLIRAIFDFRLTLIVYSIAFCLFLVMSHPRSNITYCFRVGMLLRAN